MVVSSLNHVDRQEKLPLATSRKLAPQSHNHYNTWMLQDEMKLPNRLVIITFKSLKATFFKKTSPLHLSEVTE